MTVFVEIAPPNELEVRFHGLRLVARSFLQAQSDAHAFIFIGSVLWTLYPKDTDIIAIVKPTFDYTRSEVDSMLYKHFSFVAVQKGIILPCQDTFGVIKSSNPISISSIAGDSCFHELTRDTPCLWIDRTSTAYSNSLLSELGK